MARAASGSATRRAKAPRGSSTHPPERVAGSGSSKARTAGKTAPTRPQRRPARSADDPDDLGADGDAQALWLQEPHLEGAEADGASRTTHVAVEAPSGTSRRRRSAADPALTAGGGGGATVARTARGGPHLSLSVQDAVFAVLCFEGPDRYSLAGGLGSRIAGLTEALAAAGAETHLYFIGDPHAPGIETRVHGRLTLRRWAQWISRYYPHGVYHGENEKLYDFNETVPWDLMENVVRPAAATGRHVFVLAEDWHSAELLCRCSDILHGSGLRHHATMVWNANNPMGFERINWGRLAFVSNLTTVSRYMKHYMWGLGQNPMVIPNGIPESLCQPMAQDGPARIRAAVRAEPDAPLLVKVARWDPDKRWVMAVHAIAALKGGGVRARLVAKGGIEAHQAEVFDTARHLGLRVADAYVGDQPTVESVAAALGSASDADVVNLRGFLPAEVLQGLYASADLVLANSGMEPFGLVGLEAMAAGALVMTGSTGEDYARPLENAIVLETDDPGEIARYWHQIKGRPDLLSRIRKGARVTAAEYAWPAVIEILMHRLDYLAAATGK